MPEINSGVHNHPATETGVLHAAARLIVTEQAALLPNLACVTVLLPNRHCATTLGQALCAEAGLPALLLPRLTTLKDYAASAAISHDIIPDSLRQAQIYRALRERGWFRDSDLWQISAELLALFNDIIAHGFTLPDSYEHFVKKLEDAYRARSGESMQFEARLVHELWFAMSRDSGGRVDAATAYLLQLDWLARHAAAPLYGVGLTGLTAAE